MLPFFLKKNRVTVITLKGNCANNCGDPNDPNLCDKKNDKIYIFRLVRGIFLTHNIATKIYIYWLIQIPSLYI